MRRWFTMAALVVFASGGCSRSDEVRPESNVPVNRVSTSRGAAIEDQLHSPEGTDPLLVIASPSEVHPNFYDFDRQCLQNEEECRRLGLVVVELFSGGDWGRLRGGNVLPTEERERLQEMLSPPRKGFAVYVIDPDGTVKIRTIDQPIDFQAVVAALRPIEKPSVVGKSTN